MPCTGSRGPGAPLALGASGAILLAALASLLGISSSAAQPQIPSSFYGSVTIDGKPPPDGAEVRGLIDGIDCTQLGADYKGTVRIGNTAAYVIHVMHEVQKPGCGTTGKTVTFTIGGRPAAQTAQWKQGPQELNLNAGSGEPLQLPTSTPTVSLSPAQAAATATEAAKRTPRAGLTALPTGDASLGGVGGQDGTAGSGANDGEFPLLAVLLIVLGIIGVTGTAAGVALSRRSARTSATATGASDHGPHEID
jgi:hypothetical protein